MAVEEEFDSGTSFNSKRPLPPQHKLLRGVIEALKKKREREREIEREKEK